MHTLPFVLGGCSCPMEPPPLTVAVPIPPSLQDGGLTDASCEGVCRGRLSGTLLSCAPDDMGNALCVLRQGCIGGRAPAGFDASSAYRDLPEYLAACSRLEKASVSAFRILARELRLHDAPKSLVRRARRSVGDERRHAVRMHRLALANGANPLEVAVPDRKLRPIEEIARENAVEGCVRETWGAIVAAIQAKRAKNLAIRAAMRAIAPDELRHAELSWDIHRWAMTRLSVEQRHSIVAARRKAAADLVADAAFSLSTETIAELGLPGRDEARVLAAEAQRSLWA